jgi:hypothetical protein
LDVMLSSMDMVVRYDSTPTPRRRKRPNSIHALLFDVYLHAFLCVFNCVRCFIIVREQP